MSTSMTQLYSNSVPRSEREAPRPRNPEPESPKTWADKLPGVLRSAGAAAILFALYSFLFRGWEGSNDLVRYVMLLGHTALLAIIALACGHFLREGKSPRLLFMLGLVSVPVNFAILGGFIFAGVNEVFPVAYPSFVAWSVNSLSTAIILAAVATAVLIPVSMLGFKTLARGMSGRMTLLFMAGNAALLLPLRDPLWVTVLTLSLGVYTLFVSSKTARERTEVKTFEGMIALLLQFVPVGILLGRNIWLYAPDALLFAALSIILFIALRHCSQFLTQSSYRRIVMELSSFALAISTGACVLLEWLITGGSLTLASILGGLVSAVMCYELAHRAATFKRFYRFFAMVFAAGSVIWNMLMVGTLDMSLLSVVSGLALIVFGFQSQQRSVFVSGSILSSVGVIHLAISAVQTFDVNYWLAVALLGVLAIVVASMLESRGTKIQERLRQYRQVYREWEY